VTEIRVRRFEQRDHDAVARLNERFANAGVAHVVYPEPARSGPPGPLTQRLFIAADDEEIRGAVWLKEHPFRVHGSDQLMGYPKYLIAESLIDGRFSGVPRALLRACLAEQPLLMGLGFGGRLSPMARLLIAHRWSGEPVPFLFRPVRPGRVVRELAPIRRSGTRRALAAFAHRSGLAGVGWLAVSALRARRRSAERHVTVDVEPQFGPWADDVWQRCKDSLGLLTVRDTRMLAMLLPTTLPSAFRLRVRRAGSDIGWAFVLAHDFATGQPDGMFGALNVGVVADVLARPEDARAVGRSAVDWLMDASTDIIISNQSHPAWISALHHAGLVDGPVNYASYRSPAVERMLTPDPSHRLHVHLTRADGDGPVWWTHSQ
jgi:hypothetical protein